MAWIESHQTLLTHRKTGRASRALGVSKITVIGHLHVLWWWCLDNAQDGELGSVDIEDVVDGACWEGDPQAFIDGLVFAGFLDRDETGLRVHDWMEFAGKLIDKRKSDAQRKRAMRHLIDVQRTSVGRPSDGAGTVPNSTVPYPTEQNKTEEKSREEAEAAPKKEPRAPRDLTRQTQLAAFCDFYAAYPNKQARQDAEKAWVKLSPDNTLREAIMAGLLSAKGSEEWHEDGGKYIPHPATFLNRRRWEDVYTSLGSRPVTNSRTIPRPSTVQGTVDDTARALRDGELHITNLRQAAQLKGLLL